MILCWLILIPFIGGLLSWQAERFGRGVPRWIALFSMLALFGAAAMLWVQGDYSASAALANTAGAGSHWQVEYRMPWIPYFGIGIHLGLDGLSLLMVLLTGLLGAMAVACSWSEIQRHVGFFHLNLLWSLGGVVGVFLALDLFLFFFFWEMMLVPVYFLIALWGHKGADGRSRISAATKFFIFTQAGGLLMLLAILGLVFVHFFSTGELSFDYEVLRHTLMPRDIEMALMSGFFIAFAVKFPVVPVHSWLPDAHAQAPTAGSVDLAGILLKTAAYGMLRFAIPLFPNVSHDFAPYAMMIGATGVIYGAVMALAQNDIKRMIAYTSISHMGFVLIGIYSGNLLALQGAVVLMIAHGVSAGALFILSGQVYERLHTRDLRQMGGLWSRIRDLPPLAFLFAAASLGLPGLGNFVGEFLVLFGAFQVAPVTAMVAATGLVLAAVYTLFMLQRAFQGPVSSNAPLPGLAAREYAMLLVLAGILIGLGLYPQPVLDTTAVVMTQLQAVTAAVPDMVR